MSLFCSLRLAKEVQSSAHRQDGLNSSASVSKLTIHSPRQLHEHSKTIDFKLSTSMKILPRRDYSRSVDETVVTMLY
ncbi:hypothetical protein SteCoe_20313 [Stentor coeruleus]|uniref:Uncharacterized protein n=1 Tax=Stentor coeruleus TaxID=5963 RepID=A0A1R2BSB4_9CILI|nr:hypothetical protein SteCoe_20313 [Stentor coeruleus]